MILFRFERISSYLYYVVISKDIIYKLKKIPLRLRC